MNEPSKPELANGQAVATRWRFLMAGLLLVALLTRITAAIAVDRNVENAGRQFLIEGDANGYWELGQRIASGREYSLHNPPRRILRVPGFPLLLAGSIRLFGDNIFSARIILAFIGTVCCWQSYVLGRMLSMRRVGFWACVFVAVNPLQIVSSVMILSETWFTFWMMGTLILLAYILNAPSRTCDANNSESDTPTEVPDKPSKCGLCGWRLSLLSIVMGICIGVTTLIRPGYLPWLGITVVGLLALLKRPLVVRLSVALATIAGCILIMTPWAIRNLEVSGHLVWTSLWSGPSLYDGLNADATGASDMRFFDDDQVLSQMSEFEMNQHYKQKAFDFVQQNPARTVKLAGLKATRFLSPVPNSLAGSHWGIGAVCVVFYTVFVGAIGLAWGYRQLSIPRSLLLVGPFVLFLLVHMVFVGSLRYRLPVEFPLAVAAGLGIRHQLARRSKNDLPSPS